MRGNLILTPDDQVIDVKDQDLGLLYRVRDEPSGGPIFLYAGPPSHKLDKLTKKPDEFQLVRITEEQFPAVLVSHDDEAMGVQAELKPGQHVIARSVSGAGKNVYEVITFEVKGKKSDDMPESGRAITVTNKGYVLKSHLELDASLAETFKKVSGDIFPHPNLINDVRQSIFGDCFLLSSILSILYQPGGEDFIKGMMVQQNDHTIVRLYDPRTREPVYYKISNTYHYERGKCTVKHDAPWVHILEKAYTAHAQKKNMTGKAESEFYCANPSFRDMFGEGGKPAVAMTILTGEEVSEANIHRAQSYPWDQEGLIYSMSVFNRVHPFMELGDNTLIQIDWALNKYAGSDDGLRVLKEFAAAASDVSGNDIQTIYAQLRGNRFARNIFELLAGVDDEAEHLDILHAASHYVSEHMKLCIESPLALSDALNEIRLIAKMGKFVKQELITQGKWDEFEKKVNVGSAQLTMENITRSYARLSEYDLPKDVYKRLTAYVGRETENLGWDGALGTSLYSPKTLAVYDSIRRHLADDEPVAASTRNTFSAKVFGLRPQHAYAVAGVSEEKGYRYIHVRNPWGYMGRQYHFEDMLQREHKGLPIATEERGVDFAECKIELSDFARYFGDYTVGNPPPQLAMQHITPPQRTFFQRHAAKLAGVSIGMIVGVAIGVALGFALLPFTFGVSVPLFAAIGVVVGGAVSAGLGGGLIGRAIDNKRDEHATYYEISSDDTDTESFDLDSEPTHDFSLIGSEDEEFNVDLDSEHEPLIPDSDKPEKKPVRKSRVSRSGMYGLKTEKEEMKPDSSESSPSPRKK